MWQVQLHLNSSSKESRFADPDFCAPLHLLTLARTHPCHSTPRRSISACSASPRVCAGGSACHLTTPAVPRRKRKERVGKLRELRRRNKQKAAETASLESAAAVMADALAMVEASTAGPLGSVGTTQPAAAAVGAADNGAAAAAASGGAASLTAKGAKRDVAFAVSQGVLNTNGKRGARRKQPRTDAQERERKEREKARQQRNRISAAHSRQRQKSKMDELQAPPPPGPAPPLSLWHRNSIRPTQFADQKTDS
eukprot:SAG11_NODE_104_length_16539_cov_8.526642_5_plen_253_part_00